MHVHDASGELVEILLGGSQISSPDAQVLFDLVRTPDSKMIVEGVKGIGRNLWSLYVLRK